MTGAASGPTDRSDEELVGVYADESRARSAREAAFYELTRRYRRRVFAVCYRVLDSATDAEDATQETFVKLARGAAGFRGESKLSTWLYRVARNVCTDKIRYEARRPATAIGDLTTLGQAPIVEDVTDAQATASVIETALRQLDERSRQLLLLVAVDELSYAEAAEIADLPIGTVKSRVSRARATLGALLLAQPDPAPRDPRAGPTTPADPTTTPGAEPRAPPPATEPSTG